MIDVVVMRATDQVLGSGLVRRPAGVELDGLPSSRTGATIVFQDLEPSKFTRWMAAEVEGQFAFDSLRVRFTDGATVLYMDADDNLEFKPVTVTNWDSQYTEASLLGNLDLWTRPRLGLQLHLVRTNYDRNPSVFCVRVLASYPTWEGSVFTATERIVTFMRSVTALAVHRETLTEDRSSWKLGVPYSELNLELTSVAQVTVNGFPRDDASLDNGEVTLSGPPARRGDLVEVAVLFQPNVAYRRTEHVSTVDKVPSWWVQRLVADGGQNGKGAKFQVGPFEVANRRVDLRIAVNGVAARAVDAISMRAALQTVFADGIDVVLPSCRTFTANLDGMVEVVERSALNLPMASGVVMCGFTEYVSAKRVRNTRTSQNDPTYTSVETSLPDDVDSVAEIDAVGEIC